MRKLLFSPPLPKSNLFSASANTLSSIIKFGTEIGFEPRITHRSRRSLGMIDYYSHLSRSYLLSDVFLTTYPYVCGSIFPDNPLRSFDRYFNKLFREIRHPASILYVVDLPIEQARAAGDGKRIDDESQRCEKDFFGEFDVLCVFNDAMKHSIIHQYGVSKSKFVEFEILDHATTFVPPQHRDIRTDETWTVAYAGNYSERYVGGWIGQLSKNEKIRYELIGMNWDWVSTLARPDLVDRKFLESDQLLQYLSKHAHFGIIKPSTRNWAHYYDYGTTSKMGTYLAAGLPILVSSDCTYISSLVRKYGVGIVFTELEDIPSMLHGLTKSEYESMRGRCLILGAKVRSGYFFKRAVNLAFSKLGLNGNNNS